MQIERNTQEVAHVTFLQEFRHQKSTQEKSRITTYNERKLRCSESTDLTAIEHYETKAELLLAHVDAEVAKTGARKEQRT